MLIYDWDLVHICMHQKMTINVDVIGVFYMMKLINEFSQLSEIE